MKETLDHFKVSWLVIDGETKVYLCARCHTWWPCQAVRTLEWKEARAMRNK